MVWGPGYDISSVITLIKILLEGSNTFIQIVANILIRARQMYTARRGLRTHLTRIASDPENSKG